MIVLKVEVIGYFVANATIMRIWSEYINHSGVLLLCFLHSARYFYHAWSRIVHIHSQLLSNRNELWWNLYTFHGMRLKESAGNCWYIPADISYVNFPLKPKSRIGFYYNLKLIHYKCNSVLSAVCVHFGI